MLIAYIAVLLVAVVGLGAQMRYDLMMYQQNSYRNDRYGAWIREAGDSTDYWRLAAMVVFFLGLSKFSAPVVGMALAGIFFAARALVLFRAKYKKPLVITPRAKRLMVTDFFLAALIAAVAAAVFGNGVAEGLFAATEALLAVYGFSWCLMMAAGFILQPLEKHINQGYIDDARRILSSMPGLKIIGITGSYGKTSTKHFLYRILSEEYETLMTPGNYNTTLGVVRTVRELLKPYHEVFIVEMGAKQPDDIADICRLVHPQRGIITAVGPQHLESFKTLECVQATKFELADALPSDGLVLVNNDFEMIASRSVDNTVCLRYAVRETDGADYVAVDIVYTPTGTDFTVRRNADGHALRLHTRLMGEANISDLLAAVAMAQTMGVSDEHIAYSVGRIEPVKHRMSTTLVAGGLVIIDDAYNSNPVGSAMALDVLRTIREHGRVLVTPGMVELGEKQEELNREFGRRAATSADTVIVVGRTNREAITDGLRDGGMPREHVHTVDTFAEAQALIASKTILTEVILYENDLPDTYK